MSEMKRTIEAIFDSYEIEIRMLEESIDRVRELADRMRVEYCNDELGKDWACFFSAEIIKALSGE